MKNKIIGFTLCAILCIGSACFSFAESPITAFDGLTLDGTRNADNVFLDEMTFSYEAEAETGVKSVALLFGDKQIAQKEYGKDADGNQIALNAKESGSFVISKKTLSENEPVGFEYDASLVITGGDDKMVKKEFTFKADASVPEIKVTGADDKASYNKERKVEVEVLDSNPELTSYDVTVLLNEAEAEKAENVSAKDSFSFTAKNAGKYTLKIAAKDSHENKAEKEISFMIDEAAPVIDEVKTTGTKNEGFEAFGDGSDVKLTVKASDTLTGLESILVKINNEEFTKLDITDAAKEKTLEADITRAWIKEHAAKDGYYVVTIVAKDNAGNEVTKEHGFTADVKAPSLTLSGVENEKIYDSLDVEVKGEATDDNEDLYIDVTIEREGDDEIQHVKVSSSSAIYGPALDGRYKVTMQAVDMAGNKSEAKVITFICDTTGINISDITLSDNKVNEFYSSDLTYAFDAKDEVTGISKVKVSVNGKEIFSKEYDQSVTDKVEVSETITKDWLTENTSKDSKYTMIVTVTDGAGNESVKDITFNADTKIPELVLSGAKEGKAYNTAPTIRAEIKDENTKGAMIAMIIEKDGAAYASASETNETFVVYSDFTEDGEYKAIAKSVDTAGNKSEEKTLSFIFDKTAPVAENVSIASTNKEKTVWFNDEVTIKASLKDNLTGLKKAVIKVNGKEVFTEEYSNNETAKDISALVDKAWLLSNENEDDDYKVEIIVTDVAGNKTTVKESFTADVEKPVIALSGVKQGSFVNEAPTVKASVTDKHATSSVITYTVYKDGKEYFKETKKGREYSYNAFTEDGKYRITAVAEDIAGNVSELDTLSFTYDTKAPVLSDITFDGDKNKGYSWFKDSVTINDKVSESLAGLKNITIKVNDKAVTDKDFENDTYEYTVAKLLDKAWFAGNESENGKYEVSIIVTDKAGNKATKENAFWCDVTKPHITISGIENGLYTNSTPQITCEVNDNYKAKNTIEFAVKKDAKDHAYTEKEGAVLTYDSFNKDGRYHMSVRAIDKAGNTSDVKTLTFTKDTVAPVLKITGAKKDLYSTGHKDITAYVNELNYKNMTVKADITRSLDGRTTNVGFAGVVPNKENYSKTTRVSKTGTYTVTLEAEDKAGNKAASKSLVFTIDNDKPIVKITGVNNSNGYGASVAPKVSYEDSYFKKADITLTRADGKQAKVSFKDTDNAKGGTRSYANFARIAANDGAYTLSCIVTDKAGNQTAERISFAVNRFGSTYRLNAAAKKINKDYIKTVEDDIVITERNVTGLTKYNTIVTKDGIKQDVNIVPSEGVSGGWKTYAYTFDKDLFDQEGVYQVNVTSKDTVGNFSEFLSDDNDFKFYVDKTPPTIVVSGIEENGTYKGDESRATIKVSDAIKMGSYTITCDGKTMYDSSSEKVAPESKEVILPSGLNQTVQVTAKDAAGNTETTVIEDVTISSNFFLRLWANKALFFGILAGILAAAGCFIFLAKKRRRNDEQAA